MNALVKADWNTLAAAAPLLATVPEALRERAGIVEAAGGQVLYRMGERPRSILFVLSGEVRLIRRACNGAEIVLQRSSFGFIAEASLESPAYHCEVLSAMSSRLLVFPIPAFSHALDTVPAFHKAWSSRLAGEIRKLRAQCERLALKKAEHRILHYLETEGHNGEIVLHVSRKAWAAELGLSHEALYRALARMEQANMISLRDMTIRVRAASLPGAP
jgi:CRP/FNR family transcriptional regulator, dissimilatory nitrate respiration regulator